MFCTSRFFSFYLASTHKICAPSPPPSKSILLSPPGLPHFVTFIFTITAAILWHCFAENAAPTEQRIFLDSSSAIGIWLPIVLPPWLFSDDSQRRDFKMMPALSRNWYTPMALPSDWRRYFWELFLWEGMRRVIRVTFSPPISKYRMYFIEF